MTAWGEVAIDGARVPTMSQYRYFETHQRGDAVVMMLINPSILDRLLINELGDEIMEFIEQTKPRRLIVDFQRVGHCSSEVLGGLIRAKRRVVEAGGSVALCGMKPEIRSLFRVTHLENTVFQVFDDEAAAVEAAPQD